MKKSLAAIAVSMVMITGLAPAAYAGPGNSDFGHSQREAAHERRDARHEERGNRPQEPATPDTPVTPEEPPTPDTPDTPVTPEEPVTPDTPDTPDTPVTPDTPDTPEGPVTGGTASGEVQGASNRPSSQVIRSVGSLGSTDLRIKDSLESQSSVLFLNAPKVIRHKDRMNLTAYCVLNGVKAAEQDVTFSIQRVAKGKTPRTIGKPRTLGMRSSDDGEAELNVRVRPKGAKKLTAGRYIVTATIEMENGDQETATKFLRIKKAKKK